MNIKVVITHKNGKVEHYKFHSLPDLLSYQLSLSTEELEGVEAFDVYL